jgi:putative GTP pyrophosphokinase
MASDPREDRAVQFSEQFQEIVEHYFSIQCRYQSAIREVQTKLEILDDEFQAKHSRNPIHHMQSRMKSLPSITEKLRRKGIPLTIEAATQQLTDIAGIRVICSYIDDIYTIADLLVKQDDVRVVKWRDYIKQPKPNGYRSLHIVIEIPVFLQEGKVFVPVEVQIRTIAMDFWATLEHHLRYKGLSDIPADISDELQQTAEDISRLDERMLSIRNRVDTLESAEKVEKAEDA